VGRWAERSLSIRGNYPQRSVNETPSPPVASSPRLEVWGAYHQSLVRNRVRACACHTIGVTFGCDDVLKRFRRSRRTGWYFVVSREGAIGAGDPLST
jgi:hypothetical protein